MHANINANINNSTVCLFPLNHLRFAKMEEIIELNASKMRQQGSILY